MSEHLLLKWGTLKGWKIETDKSRAAFEKYCADPVSMGAMQQEDTPGQKAALCELIDAIDGPIRNDWSGEEYSKDQAKDYVMNYGRPKPPPPAEDIATAAEIAATKEG
jgi:hypothetical protein